ncbi:MAG: nucleotide 5'-monophosphate nucleosidase PpnN [Gammaproteobacteria bacterium]|nr:nucleotide 5'-monophosphate nucleosidase PpnN [Gammaproteobacteria bacterium]
MEIAALCDASRTALHDQFRRCALAVLNSETHGSPAHGEKGFGIALSPNYGSIDVHFKNPPPAAFVDGELMRGVQEHLIAVLRDVLFVQSDLFAENRYDDAHPEQTTSAVYLMLRNAHVLRSAAQPPLAVCWGGHSISCEEYDYTKKVGYELGLRAFDICTGCGPGAMKGPMKGATISHAKQRNRSGRYLGISEPGIIAAEPPNPIVNQLVIMPDIEKRLEAFVRLGDAFIIFPGGAGTAEELLYVLGLLADPDNQDRPFPLILTGPKSSASYFNALDRFIGDTLGPRAQQCYEIIVDDPARVAQAAKQGAKAMQGARYEANDAPAFNWRLHIDAAFQRPFVPTHESMAALELCENVPMHILARDLRHAFSGIVAGNIKEQGIRTVREHGPFELHGDSAITRPLRQMLEAFIAQGRMNLESNYVPCFRFVDASPPSPQTVASAS